MTDRQALVLDLVRAHWKQHKCSPSVRWVAQQLSIYHSAAYVHLTALEKKGKLVKLDRPGRSAGWKLA